MSSVAVVGAGAWGTALAVHAARAGHDVTLWARNPASIVAGVNPRLSGASLGGVRITATLPGPADAIVLAVPTQYMRAILTGWAPAGPVVLCMKGIEAGSLMLPSEVLSALHPGTGAAILTGPNFAHEVAAGLPAAAIVAGPGRDAMIALLASPNFRLYGNDDPVGAQLGGAAKNVIAIAAGAVMGRGLAELSRLVVALGGRAETVAGLSGLGDLLLTCTGGSSRNYAYGHALGAGQMPGGTGVVEGVATAPALIARAAGIELPVCTAVAGLIAGRLTIDDAVAQLLARPRRDE